VAAPDPTTRYVPSLSTQHWSVPLLAGFAALRGQHSVVTGLVRRPPLSPSVGLLGILEVQLDVSGNDGGDVLGMSSNRGMAEPSSIS
jgi:hypothetical protein